MTNKDVQTLGQGLINVSHFLGPRFVGAISKNKIRIKRYVVDVAKRLDEVCTLKAHKELEEKINKLRIPLCERMANKDEDGKPIMKPNPSMKDQMVYDIPDMDAFEKEGEKLYGDLLKQKEKTMQDRQEVIAKWEEEEATLGLYLISEEILPEDISSIQIEGIQWMIKEYLAEMESPLDKFPEKEIIKTEPIQRQIQSLKKN